MTNQPYTRGTKTIRIKTARLVPGDRVLTEDHQPYEHKIIDGKSVLVWLPGEPGRVRDAQTKSNAVIRTVAHLEAKLGRAIGGHRAQRQYTVLFTDGTFATELAPILTWHGLAAEPKVASFLGGSLTIEAV